MAEVMGEVFRVRNGILFFGRVFMSVNTQSELRESIAFSPPQNLESAKPQDFFEYEEWAAGARSGIGFALQTAQMRNVRVSDIRIVQSASIDTNAWTITEAAAKGVWQALNYDPATALRQDIEKIVDQSWSYPDGVVPDFDEALKKLQESL